MEEKGHILVSKSSRYLFKSILQKNSKKDL